MKRSDMNSNEAREQSFHIVSSRASVPWDDDQGFVVGCRQCWEERVLDGGLRLKSMDSDLFLCLDVRDELRWTKDI